MPSSVVSWSDPVISDDESPVVEQNAPTTTHSGATILERLTSLENTLNQRRSRTNTTSLFNRSVLTPAASEQTPASHVQTIGANSVVSNQEKVKGNPPPIFNPGNDARLWILEMDDHFHLRNISEPYTQATCARSYFNYKLRARVQRLRLAGLTQPFSDWTRLQAWLLENYGPTDTRLDADLAMDKLVMKYKESVQEFVNRFETVIADLDWNEPAVCAAFRKRLNRDIVDTVHLLHPQGWPTTFASWKRLTQEAENHLKIGKRAREEQESPSRKRVRFDNETDRFSRPRSPFKERSNNIGYDDVNDAEMARRKERRRRREENLCLDCGKSGHWTGNPKCTNPQPRPKRPTPSEPTKNA